MISKKRGSRRIGIGFLHEKEFALFTEFYYSEFVFVIGMITCLLAVILCFRVYGRNMSSVCVYFNVFLNNS